MMQVRPLTDHVKAFAITLGIILANGSSFAQTGVSISDDASAVPDASAILDIKVTGAAKKGVLVPRVTQSERSAIPSPATGLLVYQTDASPGFFFFDGSLWVRIATGAGLALPFSGSDISAEYTFNITNAGTTGRATALRGANSSTSNVGLVGTNTSGLFGSSGGSGNAVEGETTGSGNAGKFEINNSGSGSAAVLGVTNGNAAAIVGQNTSSSDNTDGIFGIASSGSGRGVHGYGASSGVFGESFTGTGVFGQSGNVGVLGNGISGHGVVGNSSAAGVFSHNTSGTPGRDVYLSTSTLAGDLYGNVSVSGNLTKSGGSFRIDHPLDPANRYLYHSFVESPDMKNIYDGVVTLNNQGEATVVLPDWFEALNKDFRYQLTAIGAPAPALHIAAEVEGSSFRIAGGVEGMKVSWQVTGIRHDKWANANRIPVEMDKDPAERGFYQHPELFGLPGVQGLQYVRYPETLRLLQKIAQETERVFTPDSRPSLAR